MSQQFTLVDLAKCETNPSTEFHIVRHFSSVDFLYTQKLIGQSYWYFDFGSMQFVQGIISAEDISFALETLGGSFFPNVAGIENPAKLLATFQKRCKAMLKIPPTPFVKGGESKFFWETVGDERKIWYN